MFRIELCPIRNGDLPGAGVDCECAGDVLSRDRICQSVRCVENRIGIPFDDVSVEVVRVVVGVGPQTSRFIHVDDVFIAARIVGLAGREVVIRCGGIEAVFVALPELVGFAAAIHPSPFALDCAVRTADPCVVADRGINQVANELVFSRPTESLPIVR